MRALLRSLLAFISLGMVSMACNKSDTPAAPTDVTLYVPGMYWARGWPDRVRSALGTLPWVEQDSIQTDVDRREVRFNLKDKGAFKEEDVRKALQAQRFPEVTVKSAPRSWRGSALPQQGWPPRPWRMGLFSCARSATSSASSAGNRPP